MISTTDLDHVCGLDHTAVVNTAVSLGAGGVFIIQFKVTIDN